MNRYTTKDNPGILLPVTLAVSTQYQVLPEKSDWLVHEGVSLGYTPDSRNSDKSNRHYASFLREGVRVQHHGYFPGLEIGDNQPDKAKPATHLDFLALEAMKGVTVSLENSRRGPTSNPETFLEWTQQTGAKITMDIDHAVSSERLVNKELTVPQIIDMFSHDLAEVHFYKSETNMHHAPQDMKVLGPIVDQLLTTQSTWWAIEIDTYEDILRTRHLICNHPASASPKRVSHTNSMLSNASMPISSAPTI